MQTIDEYGQIQPIVANMYNIMYDVMYVEHEWWRLPCILQYLYVLLVSVCE